MGDPLPLGMAEPMTYESHRPKGQRPPRLERGDGAVGLSVDEIAEGSEALRAAFPLAAFTAMSTLRSQAMSDMSWAAGRRENVKLAGTGRGPREGALWLAAPLAPRPPESSRSSSPFRR